MTCLNCGMPKEHHFPAPNRTLWCSNGGKIPFKESTPFDSWYSATVAPQLEQTLKAVPEPARAPIRKASQEQMAACWNAAHEAVTVEAAQMRKAVMDYYGTNLPEHLKTFLSERLAVIHDARANFPLSRDGNGTKGELEL